MKRNIKDLSRESLEQFLQDHQIPKFRAQQINDWLFGAKVTHFSEMKNIPKSLQALLDNHFRCISTTVYNSQTSEDGTRKYILKLSDGCLIETVGIPSKSCNAQGLPERLTVCFSTQVGCAMACCFCATGHEGFTRNLSVAEMLDQIITVEQDFDMRVSNIVAMGQGEGFLNYSNLMTALKILNQQKGLEIGARHITISTCGILSGIEKLAAEPEQFTLAISLHAAIQETRDKIMPKVSNFGLLELRRSLEYYTKQSSRRFSFEYLLIKGINDDEAHLQALISYCKGLLCHVNIIQLNDIESSPYKPSSKQTLKHWLNSLEKAHIQVSLRESRGADIDGACGQLKNSLMPH